MSKAHPGFDSVAEKVAEKEHIPLDHAKAIVASAARHAGRKAKRANPRLKRVKGN